MRARYKVLRVLSSTRLRNIYIAEDLHIRGKHWVIRQMQPVGIDSGDRNWLLGQFEAEARQLSALEHPCLPKLVDFFVQDSYLYVIREFVPGMDLGAILTQRGGRLAERDALQVGLSLVDLMNYLLKKKLPPIVFRELSLTNLVFTPEGHTKLIDFGFSRLFQREARLGAPDYAAPEQYAEDAAPDARTLVYNAGALVYHLLTGHNPGTTPFALPPVAEMNAAVSERTCQLLEKATQNEPSKRFASLADLGKALQQALSAKPSSKSVSRKRGGTQKLEKIPIPVGGSGGTMKIDLEQRRPGVGVFLFMLLVVMAMGALLIALQLHLI